MRSRKTIILSLTLISLAAAGWWWKSQPPRVTSGPTAASSPAAGAAKGGPQAVGVIEARQQDVPVNLEASGTVASLASVDMRAQTTSTVKEVLIKDGDTVRKGQVLLRFDDRADRANLERARAQLLRDRAAAADAERQFKRAQELKAQNFIAQSAVDTAQANAEAARALVAADEAAVQSANVALSYNELRAPISGRAGALSVFPGSLVQASASALPLVNIAQMDPVGVSFSLAESQLQPLLAATRGAGKAGASSPEALQVQIAPTGGRATGKGSEAEAGAKGKLVFVDNLVDSTTGTIKVRAEFDNRQQQLWPGQFVRVRMTLRTIKDAIVIPQAAIIQRGNERSVYIVDADKNAQLKTVQQRYTFGEMAVVEGIQAGDKVVVDGKQNLRPGTAVKAQPAALNPAAAAAAAASKKAAGEGAGAASAASAPSAASSAASGAGA
ncbi:efflux RND transporter periplasmic adaptor subunit [Roseateles sp. PN1]|uniref:efflux RND transporter periplasmic adaptor subunit n=1 Tax=Roseateles sp. PN1 TaxID=3137372 RepID=UPI003138CFA9